MFRSLGTRIAGVLRRSSSDDEGLTLVECLVAILLLALVSISILPIITQSLIQSVNNSELVTATSLANQAIEVERAQSTCSGLSALNTTMAPRPNVTLHTVRTVGACPASYPGTVQVNVTVTNTTTGTVEIKLGSLIFVKGA